MQQRIIVKVPMKKEKDRSTAMKVAAGTTGVSSVKIGGEERDKVIVIGNEVDAVILTQLLIKKFGGATRLVRVEPLLDSRRFHQPPSNYNSYDMIYDDHVQPSNYMNYTRPVSYYNNPPPPPPSAPPYYYSYDQPAYDSSCSIM